MKKNYMLLIQLIILSLVAYCPSVKAEILINQTFEGTSGANISTLGWTNALGQIVISNDVIDTGKSAKNNVGGWSVYTKDLSTRGLLSNETAVLTWAGKVNTSSVNDASVMTYKSDDKEWQYYFFAGGFRAKVYQNGIGYLSTNDFETTLTNAKFRFEINNRGSKFFYDIGSGWVEALSNNYGSNNAGILQISNLGTSWIDSIKYEIFSESIPNVYVHMLRYSSSLLVGAIWPSNAGTLFPPSAFTIIARNSNNSIVMSESITSTQALAGATIPISLSSGAYHLYVYANFSNGSSQLVWDRDWRYTVTPSNPVVSLSNQGVYSVSGANIFPLGLYHVRSWDISSVGNVGINMAMSIEGVPTPPSWLRDDGSGYVEKCAVDGIKCVSMAASYLEPGNIEGEAILNYYENNPNVAFWYVYDEPERSLLPTCQRWYEQGVNWDPTHPFFILQCVPSTTYRANEMADMVNYFAATSQAGDIFAVDPYPIGNNLPIREVYHSVEKAVNSVFGKKPVWATLQSYTYINMSNGSFKDPRLPTRKEIKCMSYLALAAGARGIMYYAFDDTYWSDGIWRGVNLRDDCSEYWKYFFSPCIAELKQNSNIWTANYASGTPINETPVIVVQKKPYVLNNKVYMLVVNPEPTTQYVSVSLPQSWSNVNRVTDILGGTKATLSSSVLTDRLSPLQAKCYELPL